MLEKKSVGAHAHLVVSKVLLLYLPQFPQL